MATAMKFGRMVRNAREKQKISQEKLASNLGLSRISINNYEQGRQAPNLHTAVKIAYYLKIELDELVQAIDKDSLTYALDHLPDKDLSHTLKGIAEKIEKGGNNAK